MIQDMLRLLLVLLLALTTGWAFWHWLDPDTVATFINQQVMCN